MSKHTPLRISVSTVINAPAEAIYDLVADVRNMAKFSPEITSVAWVKGATGPVVGAQFTGSNRLGKAKWTTKPTVVAADRGTRFSFKVPGGFGPEWTYAFEPVAGGQTRVTESMVQTKPSPAIIRFIQRRNGVVDRAANLRESMNITLDRIAHAAETAAGRPPASVRASVAA